MREPSKGWRIGFLAPWISNSICSPTIQYSRINRNPFNGSQGLLPNRVSINHQSLYILHNDFIIICSYGFDLLPRKCYRTHTSTKYSCCFVRSQRKMCFVVNSLLFYEFFKRNDRFYFTDFLQITVLMFKLKEIPMWPTDFGWWQKKLFYLTRFTFGDILMYTA